LKIFPCLVVTACVLLLASSSLASRLSVVFDTRLAREAYELRLSPDQQHLRWIETTPGGPRMHDTEPGSSVWRRGNFLSILPIEGLL
jgi:putative cardiolipin synthase